MEGKGAGMFLNSFIKYLIFRPALRFNFKFLETCEPHLGTTYTCVRVWGEGGGKRGTVVFKQVRIISNYFFIIYIPPEPS